MIKTMNRLPIVKSEPAQAAQTCLQAAMVVEHYDLAGKLASSGQRHLALLAIHTTMKREKSLGIVLRFEFSIVKT
jgi:hypothetical protein